MDFVSSLCEGWSDGRDDGAGGGGGGGGRESGGGGGGGGGGGSIVDRSSNLPELIQRQNDHGWVIQSHTVFLKTI